MVTVYLRVGATVRGLDLKWAGAFFVSEELGPLPGRQGLWVGIGTGALHRPGFLPRVFIGAAALVEVDWTQEG